MSFDYPVKAKGGQLRVTGKMNDNGVFTDLQLIGPAAYVFSGIFGR
jgi:hypothetical protein